MSNRKMSSEEYEKAKELVIENIMNIYKKGATFNECINTLISFTE